VVTVFISKIMNDEPITVFGDGSNTRPFTYVGDIVEANMLAANSTDTSILGETFNVTSGKSVSISDLISAISTKLGKKPRIVYGKERMGEIKHMVADITKIRQKMKFKPTVAMQEGVFRTVEYYAKI
ncbi:MAG: GDP-mannose 4,6-dehydratase, partial [Candidatus Diapherotrites archaeon]|nr:GDP-mannose 4,6-dehydratase [Candidatus Diapherotrites archaeon]